ncbi:S24 family peptidase [Shinella sp. NM-101]|uniref:S24 family peptidase n=1 Tax=Shinella sp. NM-101 TaxID=2744455 RepID=UPI001F285CE4|nr:S24 family peptidase [Shinella sp. NM-101]
MANQTEHFEREKRAARLKEARIAAEIGGYRKLAQKFGWNENTYKGHEQAKSSFGIVDARKYAKAFGVSLRWLFMGEGLPDDQDEPDPVSAIDVPLISWISAGALGEHDGITDFSEFPTISALDLPEGDWIALRVEGDSMNKISPPGSVIFANRRDRRLVYNACYVVADERGNATYKRYRSDESPPFQPASYKKISPPDFTSAVNVIGRVRRSVIDM